MSNKIYLLLTGLFVFSYSLVAQVQINEFSASNIDQFIDQFGKYEDWVELYNPGSSSVDLGGWFLSDNDSKPQKWEIPVGISIPANGYLVFWCSGRDTVMINGMHTSFKLTQTKGTETLVLTQADGNIVNSIDLGITLLDHSQARETDGSNVWKIVTNPTPGTSNDNSNKIDGYTSAPAMNISGGFYAGPQTVTISATEPNSVLRYTLDGNLPTSNSPEYIDPINITTTTVVKARSFSNDPAILPGKIVFNTYFIDEDFSLAVFSVAADQVMDLANGQGTIIPIGSLEYFNTDKQRTSTSYGSLNRHGQDSWVLNHRSIDWVSRDEMGYSKALDEKLFSYSDRTEFQRFMFRASGDDNYPAINDGQHEFSTHIRDEYVHALAQEGGMKLDVRAVERVVVFLNGQYWGVYGLRERPVDHDYTKEYYDQDKYNTQYLTTWGNTEIEYGGQKAQDDWEEIRDFILDNDMSDSANYQRAKDNIQLVSLIDYMIANLNSVASDWLNYNTGWWRGINPDGDHKKWGYILWDNDATFDYYINYSGVPDISPNAKPCDIDEIADFMDGFFGGYGGEDVGKHEKIFLKLQEENDEFRQLYYSRQADLMNTVYTCENMLETLDRMVAVIAPEMPRQIQRWGGSVQEWEQNVLRLRGFIEERCEKLDDGMVTCFELEGPHKLTLLVEPDGVGEIDLNTLDIEEFPWSGNYFEGMDNILKAKALDDDYKFIRWESKAGNELEKIYNRRSSIRLTQADTLIAHFGIPTAVQEVEPGVSFEVFPTIVEDQLTLNYELEEAKVVSISLLSVLGNTVIDFPEVSGRMAPGQHSEQLEIGSLGLPTGLYFLNFRANEGMKSVKVQIIN